MKILQKTVFCLMTCGAAITSSQATIFQGFYLGVQGGYSSVPYTNSYFNIGARATKINGSGFAQRVFIGYDFNPFIAAEVNVAYLKKPKFTQVTVFPFYNDSQIKNNIVSLLGRINLPLTPELSVNAKGGIGYVVRDAVKSGPYTVLNEGNYGSVVYGLGAAYNLSCHWVLDATWIQAPENFSKRLPAANFYGIGLQFKFS